MPSWSFWAIFLGLFRIFWVLADLSMRRRSRRLAAERIGITRADFICYFDGAVPRIVLDAVYDYFGNWMKPWVTAFPVLPSDVINDIYRIDSEQFDLCNLPDLLEQCDRQMPPQDRQLHPLVTVEHLVEFIAACPTKAETGDLTADAHFAA